jgi:hypothetical protein
MGSEKQWIKLVRSDRLNGLHRKARHVLDTSPPQPMRECLAKGHTPHSPKRSSGPRKIKRD